MRGHIRQHKAIPCNIRPHKAIQGHIRPYKANTGIQYHYVPQRITLCTHCNWDFMNFSLNFFYSLAHFLFELDSTRTPTTKTKTKTTKFLVGLLSVARAQKTSKLLYEYVLLWMVLLWYCKQWRTRLFLQ